MYDDWGNSREDQDNVANESDEIGVLDGEVTAPVLIRKIGAKERCEVGPELVDLKS